MHPKLFRLAAGLSEQESMDKSASSDTTPNALEAGESDAVAPPGLGPEEPPDGAAPTPPPKCRLDSLEHR